MVSYDTEIIYGWVMVQYVPLCNYGLNGKH